MTVQAWRVAQLAVERGPGGAGSRGSGYLIAPGRVLTAAHVVAGASAVRVRLDVGQPAEVEVRAEDWWADPAGSSGTDLAVVLIPGEATAGRDVEPARFGQIGDCTAVLAVQAFGFPGFKLRPGPAGSGGPGAFRDLEQVTGHAPVAANRRQGTLAVYLDDPAPAAAEPGGPSPWAGMSGAAVWADDRIVAVDGRASPRRGHRPAHRPAHRPGLRPAAEPDLDRLVDWLGLAASIGGLPDVVPAGPGQLVRSAYLEQVRDIAPDELIGRDGELAEWAGFCADREAYAGGRPGRARQDRAGVVVRHPSPGRGRRRVVLHHRPPGRPTATHSWTP